MKKTSLALCWVLAVSCLSSCQKEPLPGPAEPSSSSPPPTVTLSADEQERLPLLSEDYSVSHQELLARGEALLKGFAADGVAGTKGLLPAILIADSLMGTVTIPSSPFATKSEGSAAGTEQPTKIYLLNFGQDEGFAYVAGDRRVQDWLLAWADEGTTSLDTDNPGMRLMQDEMQAYVEREIARLESMRGDSVYEALCARFAPGMLLGTKVSGPGGLIITDPNDPNYIDPTAPEGSWENPMGEFIYGLTIKCAFGVSEGEINPSRDDPAVLWRWIKVDKTAIEEIGYESREMYMKGPLLTTKWGQGWPYNTIVTQYYPYSPTGCVATAVAQIMNYWEHPLSTDKTKDGSISTYLWDQFKIGNAVLFLDGYPYRHDISTLWDYTTDEARNSVAQLMYDLGVGGNLNMEYSTSGSEASSKLCGRTFSNFGYNHGGLGNFAEGHVESSLDNNRPVYMSGRPSGAAGHAWVLDGYKKFYLYRKFMIVYYYQFEYTGQSYTEEAVNYSYLFHCNWGWNGDGDCWVSPNNFETVANAHAYDLDKMMIGQIYPNNL